MDFKIMRCLWFASTDDSFPYEDGLNLGELYSRTPEAKEADAAFVEAIDKAALPEEIAEELRKVALKRAEFYEFQGFVNGFRFCRMLEQEIFEH